MNSPAPSVTDELERLAALHKSGVLTDDEFKEQKSRILNPVPPAASPPPKKRRSLLGRIVLWIVLGFIAFVVFALINAEYPEVFLSGLPKCDSPEARKMVERTVEENSVGLASGRKIIQWVKDTSRESATTSLVRCHARVAMNAGGETDMTYSFEKKSEGIYINVEFN